MKKTKLIKNMKAKIRFLEKDLNKLEKTLEEVNENENKGKEN